MKILKQIMIVWCCIFLTTVYAEERTENDLETYLDVKYSMPDSSGKWISVTIFTPEFIKAWDVAQKIDEIERGEEHDEVFELARKIKKILDCSDCSPSEKKFFIGVLNIVNDPDESNKYKKGVFMKILTPDLKEKYHIGERGCLTGYCQAPHRREVMKKILNEAIRTNRKQLVELLIDVGLVHVNFSSSRYARSLYNFPLMLAVVEGRKEIVQLLINYGADVTLKNHQGDTVLKIAEEKGNTEIVEMLRKALADKLFEAVKAGNKELVQSLIDSGADVDAKNSYGDTALFIAERNADEPNGDTEIVEMLKKAGAQ